MGAQAPTGAGQAGATVGQAGGPGRLDGYRRLLRYAFRQWPRLLAIVLLTVLASGIAVLHPWPLKILVDHALSGEVLPPSLAAALAAVSLPTSPATLILFAGLASLAIVATGAALDAALNWAWTAAGQRMVYDLAADLFRRLQRLSLLFHARRSVGDSLNRLSGDTWCVYKVTESLLVSPLQQVLTLAAIGLVAWRLDATLTLLSLSVIPVSTVGAFFFGRWLKQRARQQQVLRSRLMAFVQQTIAAMPVVQAFGAEARNRDHFMGLARRGVSLARRNVVLNQSFGFIEGLATTLAVAMVLYAGGQRVLGGSLTVGGLLVFLAYVRTIQGAVRALLKTYVEVQTVEASMERVLEVMDADEMVREAPGARPFPKAPAGARGHVRLDGVSFGYEPGRPVLRDVSLEVPPGATVALVGPSGAGKSTLVSLIPRFYDPWEGSVTIDGMDLRGMQLASLREHVALVLQEPFLLPLTVAENIAYGRPGASRDEIVAAAVMANAHDFIARLPEGYDTVLGERGATLSGGQRQCLSIARALLKDAPVLILDEPTSALDAETEAMVFGAMQRLVRKRTTFVIAHRLATVRNANRILVIEDGTVVDTGTHDELLARDGPYRRLHALQVAPGRRRKEPRR